MTTRCPRLRMVVLAGILFLVSRAADVVAADPCEGNAFARLELQDERASIGETATFTLTGTRLERVAIVADVGPGPVSVPGVGTICLDLGTQRRILHDGIRQGYPRTGGVRIACGAITLGSCGR